jgi:transcriptional regulator with XRE-family HTH domain
MDGAKTIQLAKVRDLVRSGAARTIREAAGLSYRELADACGVSTPTVWRWEHGERTPRGDPALRYGAVLAALIEARAPQ